MPKYGDYADVGTYCDVRTGQLHNIEIYGLLRALGRGLLWWFRTTLGLTCSRPGHCTRCGGVEWGRWGERFSSYVITDVRY